MGFDVVDFTRSTQSAISVEYNRAPLTWPITSIVAARVWTSTIYILVRGKIFQQAFCHREYDREWAERYQHSEGAEHPRFILTSDKITGLSCVANWPF